MFPFRAFCPSHYTPPSESEKARLLALPCANAVLSLILILLTVLHFRPRSLSPHLPYSLPWKYEIDIGSERPLPWGQTLVCPICELCAFRNWNVDSKHFNLTHFLNYFVWNLHINYDKIRNPNLKIFRQPLTWFPRNSNRPLNKRS